MTITEFLSRINRSSTMYNYIDANNSKFKLVFGSPLTKQETQVINLIQDCARSSAEIASILKIDKLHASGVLKRLTDRGYLLRRKEPNTTKYLYRINDERLYCST